MFEVRIFFINAETSGNGPNRGRDRRLRKGEENSDSRAERGEQRATISHFWM